MQTFRFQGNGYEYFKIWIVNILLTIVTLGVYYPWAKVRNHRYFYGNTFLENRNFEYHATGGQLFKGYMIAMGIVFVLAILESISSALAMVSLLLVGLATPWIIWRSLMFNMSITSFSNVRFSFKGDVKEAYIIYLAIPVAAILAVALLIVGASFASGPLKALLVLLSVVAVLAALFGLQAYLAKRSMEYQINGTHYGQGKFHTSLSAMKFLSIMLKTVGLGLLLFMGLFVVIGLIAAMMFGVENILELSTNLQDPEATAALLGSGLLVLAIIYYVAFFFVFYVVMAYSTVRTRQYIYSNTVLDTNIRFDSTVTVMQLATMMITNLLLIIVSAGMATPWAKVRVAKLMAGHTAIAADDLDHFVTQQEEHQSSLGEQLGDALDIDVGAVGI